MTHHPGGLPRSFAPVLLEETNHKHSVISPNSKDEAEQFLKALVANGGPTADLYPDTMRSFEILASVGLPAEYIQGLLEPALTLDTIQGFGLRKPRGYAGDFEMIDRIYTKWISPDESKARWDEFFRAQHAPAAVRNRIKYFRDQVCRIENKCSPDSINVLNVGSGPGRDVLECLKANTRAKFDCIDIDENALAYARNLCREYSDRIRFYRQNVLRLSGHNKYQLIWSAGLFDYFSDRLFCFVLRRLASFLDAPGEIIIGNFGIRNPSRIWMETVGNWRLEHRSAEQLCKLAVQAHLPPAAINVYSEPEGVNLFLHIYFPEPITSAS
jgi:extracellular factor (EF) 3-hydroxypalmitic acid methyl ester biosynthesis protein